MYLISNISATIKATMLVIISGLVITCHSSCFLVAEHSRKSYKAAAEMKPFDAIIVPGYPPKKGHWGHIMRERVIWSYVLYKNGYTKNIIFSGAANYSAYQEGLIMAQYAESLGIPKENILCDTEAQHSTENVYYAYLIAKENEFKSIALATDRAQAYFLRKFIRKRFTTPIYTLPIIVDSIHHYRKLHPVIHAEMCYIDSFVSIRSEQNIIERIIKREGNKIDYDSYEDGKLPEL